MGSIRYRLSAGRALLTVEDYRRSARRAVPEMVWAYVDGGAEDHVTLRRNLEAFQRWGLRQRVLTGVGEPDLHVEIAGVRLSLPVLLAPTGLTGIAHWHGELGAAQAAERFGTRSVVSNAATYSLQEVADGTTESHWFQLYPWGNNRSHMREMLRRAEACGYHALFVTVDVPTFGLRETELRRGMGVPPLLTPRRILDGAIRPRWAYGFLRHRRFSLRNLVDETGADAAVRSVQLQAEYLYPDMNWGDLDWLRAQWPGPVFVKGILDPEDAELAMAMGLDGLVVSNHGGRQLEGAAATLDALPAIVDAVAGRGQVLLDGGVRRGSDIVKALSLGASGVLIGRPLVYGLAARGREGVTDVLEILRSELHRTMVLMGCRSVRELDASCLLPVAPLVPAAWRGPAPR
jgi:isopentenyl diphosphate isomerase/L-lactate dehydrogenase-like FMN-dependent dehydrogenase